MRVSTFLAAFALLQISSAIPLASAPPKATPSEVSPKVSPSSKAPVASKVPAAKGATTNAGIGQSKDATSCPSQPLTPATWTSLKIDTFLTNWSAKNVTTSQTNNIQALAASFGAPNFFCGLDNFCNAGQPCLPVTLPAWYSLVAIQNWNSYMNSMNTALNFASTMVSLTLPSIVNDFYPKPNDNITPLLEIGKIFTSVLGIVPFTGPVKGVASALTSGLGFVTSVVRPPAQPNLFLSWSNVASSMATVLQSYQGAISTAITTTMNAPVGASNGINKLIAGGNFLGVSQNFTEADIQSSLIKSTQVLGISLALQAQKMFIAVSTYPDLAGDCVSACHSGGIGNSLFCVAGSGTCSSYMITQSDSHGNANNLDKMADLLISKYGMAQQTFLQNPVDCFHAHQSQQLFDPFSGSIPLDSTTACLFNVLVCDLGSTGAAEQVGFVQACRNLKLAV